MARLALCESIGGCSSACSAAPALRHAASAALTLRAVAWGAQSALGEIRLKG